MAARFPQAIRAPADSLSLALGESGAMDTQAYGRTATARWRVDGVDFDARSAWGMTVARGHFDRVAGVYEVSAARARIELAVDVRSLVTASGMWDNLLRSAEPSGIAQNPEVRFTSTRVFDLGAGKLHVEGRLEATGNVIPVEFDAVLHSVDERLELEAATVVDEQHLGRAGAQLGLILPATVHVRAHLTAARTD